VSESVTAAVVTVSATGIGGPSVMVFDIEIRHFPPLVFCFSRQPHFARAC
jgi:uridine phosphorylase